MHNGEVVAMPKPMIIEPVSAFNGMDVLVARDEGLFIVEGLDLRSAAEGSLEHPVTNQGRLLERGEADMFQG